MEVTDHQPHAWFLLEDAGHHYLDVNCHLPMVDISILLRLDEDEEAGLRGRGHAFADQLASTVADSPDRFSPRNVGRGDLSTEVSAAIAGWRATLGLAPGEWPDDRPAVQPAAVESPQAHPAVVAKPPEARRSSAKRKRASLSHREELLRAFRIGPEDIAANRDNRLGPGQIRRLRRNIWINTLAVSPFMGAILAFAVFSPRKGPFLYVFCGVLLAPLVVMLVAWTRGIRRSIQSGVVHCLAGPVTVQSHSRGGTWLIVQGERNRLWTGYWHVGRDLRYRVYVSRPAKLIVAMEPDGWG